MGLNDGLPCRRLPVGGALDKISVGQFPASGRRFRYLYTGQ